MNNDIQNQNNYNYYTNLLNNINNYDFENAEDSDPSSSLGSDPVESSDDFEPPLGSDDFQSTNSNSDDSDLAMHPYFDNYDWEAFFQNSSLADLTSDFSLHARNIQLLSSLPLPAILQQPVLHFPYLNSASNPEKSITSENSIVKKLQQKSSKIEQEANEITGLPNTALGESLKNLPPESLNNLPLRNYLKIYQMRAVAQMRRIKSSILAFSMGLGKTITMAACSLELFKNQKKPILLVATKSTRIQTRDAFREAFALNALDEIEEKINKLHITLTARDAYLVYSKIQQFKACIFNPELQQHAQEIADSFIKLHPMYNFDFMAGMDCYNHQLSLDFSSFKIFDAITDLEDFSNIKKIRNQQKVVFITPSELDKHFQELSKIQWGGIMVDEAQKIHNSKTKCFKHIEKLQKNSQASLILATGTPIENKLSDISALLSLLEPQIDPKRRKELEQPLGEIASSLSMIQNKINASAKGITKFLENKSDLIEVFYPELRELFS